MVILEDKDCSESPGKELSIFNSSTAFTKQLSISSGQMQLSETILNSVISIG